MCWDRSLNSDGSAAALPPQLGAQNVQRDVSAPEPNLFRQFAQQFAMCGIPYQQLQECGHGMPPGFLPFSHLQHCNGAGPPTPTFFQFPIIQSLNTAEQQGAHEFDEVEDVGADVDGYSVEDDREDGRPPAYESFESLPPAKRQSAVVDVKEQQQVVPDYDLTAELPDECISHIFGLLSETRDRFSCALVCRRWLHLQGMLRFEQATPSPAVAELHAASTCAKVPSSNPEPISMAGATDGTEDCSKAGGLYRTLEGKHACDARLMAMAISLQHRGGLERLALRGYGLGRQSSRLDDSYGSKSPSELRKRRRAAHECNGTVLPLTASGLQAIALASPGMRSLSIWNCPGLDDEAISAVASVCPQLEKVDVLDCPRMSDRALLSLARFAPNLTALDVAGCSLVTDEGLRMLSKRCLRLNTLSLTDCPRVGGRGLAILGSACKSLSKVKLAGPLGITDNGFKLMSEHLCGVQRLRIGDLSQLSEAGLSCLGRGRAFKNLRALSVASCPGMTDAALEVVAGGCRGLKSIGLLACQGVSDDGVAKLVATAGSLEVIVFHQLPITEAAALHALEHGKGLKSFTISACKGVRDSFAASEGLLLTNRQSCLNSLRIENCAELGNGCLAAMGRAAAGATLDSLDLCGLPLAGDEGVSSLLAGCGDGLRSVDLTGCARVTDKTVCAITERCGNSVRSLCLDGCSQVSDDGLVAIASGCTVLEDLDLSRCNISDKGIGALVSRIGHSLVNLSVSGCRRLTDRSLEHILMECQSLSGLNLKNCPGLSREVLRMVKQRVASLNGPTCLFVDP